MCELLGMSANIPTDICFSFSGLIQRGGKTGPHKDGWGITFYEGKGCRIFRDPNPSYDSPIAHFVRTYPIKSQTVISHIRQANSGAIALENTHPFIREWQGKHWTFAHNGQLKGFKSIPTGHYIPVGTTDSEHAFCGLLHSLNEKYRRKPANWPAVFRFIAQYAETIRKKGVFNILLSDGEYLFASCSTNLYFLTRKAPFGKAVLLDEDLEVDFQKETTSNDVVTIIATQPLTRNEPWEKVQPNQSILFLHGERIF
ncbi:class II glutamine amidotransferase [Thorsellia anophelis]|uniref:Glutamine amidotransferase n=1 Tax=Thorsellia anophelis DSM 18579 TaxID=1123402 RepID=A0A1H9Y3V1_9GAMM|nr:class II glutamine amidotransferase [Thorsellia anophelis]SES63345.1 glutamine amidotransferase [Thorsellia anophelis DSM 18579]